MTAVEERRKKLVLEAYSLSEDIASTDKKIEEHARKYNGALMTWLESLDTPQKFVVEIGMDKAVDKVFPAEEGLKVAMEALLKLFKVGKYAGAIAGVTAKVVVDVFKPMKNNNAKVAFYDDNSKLMDDYDSKKERLNSIYSELFIITPPTYDVTVDICKRERCWQARDR